MQNNFVCKFIQNYQIVKTGWLICHSYDWASWYILMIKANKMHDFSNLFW